MQFSCHLLPHHFRSRGAVLGSCWLESMGLINTTALLCAAQARSSLGPVLALEAARRLYLLYTQLLRLQVNEHRLPGTADTQDPAPRICSV